jgi:putative tryptophan/tyrosine transport system substrate-binding protein
MAIHIRRRELIAALGVAAAWPVVARGQQQGGKLWRIGFLSSQPRERFGSHLYAGFQQGMHELGYIEGKDFISEWRSADGKYERLPDLASELVRLKVDVLVTGLTAAVGPLQQATATIPIVMAYSTDPVGNRFVASLAHPGGNVTGLAGSSDDTAPKQLELLAAVLASPSRIALLGNPDSQSYHPVRTNVENAAKKAGLSVVTVEARNPQEITDAFAAFAREGVQAVIVVSDGVFFGQQRRLAEFALKDHLPSMFAQREHVEAGGLMSYGENLSDFFRRAASFVDKIFKGANPGDLPIEQPTKFNLTINRRTADALGVTIPPQLYIFADEIIE